MDGRKGDLRDDHKSGPRLLSSPHCTFFTGHIVARLDPPLINLRGLRRPSSFGDSSMKKIEPPRKYSSPCPRIGIHRAKIRLSAERVGKNRAAAPWKFDSPLGAALNFEIESTFLLVSETKDNEIYIYIFWLSIIIHTKNEERNLTLILRFRPLRW